VAYYGHNKFYNTDPEVLILDYSIGAILKGQKCLGKREKITKMQEKAYTTIVCPIVKFLK
jgi:hypothetical protein